MAHFNVTARKSGTGSGPLLAGACLPVCSAGPETRYYVAQFLRRDSLVGLLSDVLVVTAPGVAQARARNSERPVLPLTRRRHRPYLQRNRWMGLLGCMGFGYDVLNADDKNRRGALDPWRRWASEDLVDWHRN
jgi:hypothetical protein